MAALDVIVAANAVSDIEWQPCDALDDPAFLEKYPAPQVRFYEQLRDTLARWDDRE